MSEILSLIKIIKKLILNSYTISQVSTSFDLASYIYRLTIFHKKYIFNNILNISS